MNLEEAVAQALDSKVNYFLEIIEKLPDSSDVALPGYVYLVYIDPDSNSEESGNRMFSDKIALREFVKKNYNDISSIVNIKLDRTSLLERLEYIIALAT